VGHSCPTIEAEKSEQNWIKIEFPLTLILSPWGEGRMRGEFPKKEDLSQ